jgi:hypothetical protein
MRATAALALLVGLLLLTAVPALASTNAWTPHSVSTAGFTVSAPQTWVDVTRPSPKLLNVAKQIPSLASLADLTKTSKAVKLVLVDAGTTTLRSHYATNMNVVIVPTFGDLRLLRDASVVQLKSTGVVVGNVVASTYVTLPAGRAVQLRYRARYTPSAPVVFLLQYLLIRHGNSVVLTYTTLPKLRTAYSGVFARSAASLRFR